MSIVGDYVIGIDPKPPKDDRVLCPVCGCASGDDWSQCGSTCPIPGSPHYDPYVDPEQAW